MIEIDSYFLHQFYRSWCSAWALKRQLHQRLKLITFHFFSNSKIAHCSIRFVGEAAALFLCSTPTKDAIIGLWRTRTTVVVILIIGEQLQIEWLRQIRTRSVAGLLTCAWALLSLHIKKRRSNKNTCLLYHRTCTCCPLKIIQKQNNEPKWLSFL